MTTKPFIHRVVLHNYKSIAYCDVALRPLTYLVGHNGAGKSNFLDALHFVRDALSHSLTEALNARGGFKQVCHRGMNHAQHISIYLELSLPTGQIGKYGFFVTMMHNSGAAINQEVCIISGALESTFFHVKNGRVESNLPVFPPLTSDRLALVAASGLPVFRPVFDALTSMGFYNLNPERMREMQKSQDGRMLSPAGENIASAIGFQEKLFPEKINLIQEYLRAAVPTVQEVKRITLGPVETLRFQQGDEHFFAQNMSDGTLRTLGVLLALFQGGRAFSPSLIGIEEPETALHPGASAVLREALSRASATKQILVTSHSPDLLDDHGIDADAVLAVVSEAGETKIAPLDEGSRQAMRDHLFSAGELLRMNQLEPDRASIEQQNKAASGDLFSKADFT